MKKEELLYHVGSMEEELPSRNIDVHLTGLRMIIEQEIENSETTRKVMIRNDNFEWTKIAEERIAYNTVIYASIVMILEELNLANQEIKEHYSKIKKALSDECLATESDNATVNK